MCEYRIKLKTIVVFFVAIRAIVQHVIIIMLNSVILIRQTRFSKTVFLVVTVCNNIMGGTVWRRISYDWHIRECLPDCMFGISELFESFSLVFWRWKAGAEYILGLKCILIV